MLIQALIYLCAAVISVPLAKRLGLGSVLGYLLAGVIIGPFALQLVGDQADVMHFAEFGVVMMLFLIGLELRPSLLWQMRRPILGLGGLQVLLSAALVTLAIIALSNLSWRPALAVGLAVALSSTAIVIQSLTERGLLKTEAGSNAFAVLLFQDIAVIPILALLPLLAVSGAVTPADSSGASLDHSAISELPALAQIGVSIATIAAIIAGGKFLASPIFRFIAETRLREIFTAFALLVVVAIAALMQAIGLSPALGTFLAGVVLAENEFRHEIEVNIEPFKGLLLGLFFITVGASIDFGLLISDPLFISAAVIGLIVLKAAVLGFLARLFKMAYRQGLLFMFTLAQGGEFAFVIVSAAKQFRVLDTHTGDLLTVIVALSMLLSPVLIVFYEYAFSRPQREVKEADADIAPSCDVIIAGYGRFGQIVGRLLQAQNYQLTILDHSPSQIELVRGFGNTVYYGDAARHDLLEAAGAENAKMLVVAVDDQSKSIEIITTAKKHFPQLKILARAIDRRHAYELMRLDVDSFRRETFDSALHLGVDALKTLGLNDEMATSAGKLFTQHDEESLKILYQLWGDDKSYGIAIRQRLEDLKLVLQADQAQHKKDQQPAEETT